MAKDTQRKNKLEDSLYELMEETVKTMKVKVKKGDECSAADLTAACTMLKNNNITLEGFGAKGDEPDLPGDEEIDLPFQPLKVVK